MRRLGFALALFCTSFLSVVSAQNTSTRDLRNSAEVYRELTITPASQAAVKDYFPSFLDYQDMVMFHPKFGYYSSGRVSFSNDYQTFPIVLAPMFGQMIAEHLFNMWDGMRAAGTLNATETFTIGEFGAGNGAMAESILEYIQRQAETSKDSRWAAFARQAMYVCYDRSPALNDVQRERNKRFGSRFAARLADATDLTASISKGSLKGVVLSNELPDAFSVHKVILSANGNAEVAFVAPSLPSGRWAQIRTYVSDDLAKKVDAGDLAIEKTFFRGIAASDVYLTKDTFSSLLGTLITHKEYESVAMSLEFHEIYVPVSTFPELAAHLRRYAADYANVLAKNTQGILTYINLGAEKMVQGSADILKAGYVMTIDYGSTWNGILGTDGSPHFRTYGPAHRQANLQGQLVEVSTSDPYDAPTLNDMTTDVNFSLLAIEGQQVGLKTLYFGSQKALQSGTPIVLEQKPEFAPKEGYHEKFTSWSSDFMLPGVYKLMVQQKEGTDARYEFPDLDPESLGLSRSGLTEAQRKNATDIEKRLAGGR